MNSNKIAAADQAVGAPTIAVWAGQYKSPDALQTE